MIEALIVILIWLLVLAIVFYIVRYGAGLLGIPEPVVRIVGLILGLVWLLVVLRAFGVWTRGIP